MTWSRINADVYFDENLKEWVAVRPGVGRLVQRGGSRRPYPDFATSWVQYAIDDTDFTNIIEEYPLIQVECNRN